MPKKKRNYKSVLERDFANLLDEVNYEIDTFEYVRISHYTPDWKIGPSTYIETKGQFAPAQRSNLVAFKSQHPDIRICLVFSNATNRLNSRSKISYGDWASKHGFDWHDLDAIYNKKLRRYEFRNPKLPSEWFKKGS